MPTDRAQPNIIFILTDDQRGDTIHALGNQDLRTPTLDGLVARGTAFREAHIMGGTHGAVCMPSRNMLMTGRSLFRIGGETGESIPPEHTTLPECLRQQGYHTHHVGKWHQDRESFHRSFCSGARIFGFTRGWYVQYGGHWNVAVHDFDPSGAYPEDAGYLLGADKQSKMPLVPGLGGVHSSEMFSDAAIEFLDDHAQSHGDDPFFLYLAYVAPHDPRQSPEAYEKKYDACDLPTPPNYLARHPFDNGAFDTRDEMLEAWPRRPHAVRRHLADYYACIEHLDAQIGRVLDSLEHHGMDDNTILVFAGDNGLGIGSHGLMGKQNLYEHSVRVPLLFAGPGIREGRRRDDLCYLYDIYPTLCDLLDFPTPSSVEGVSVAGALNGDEPAVRRCLYHGYRGVQRAVREPAPPGTASDLKLIEYVAGDERHTQLFDLARDPEEQENLADRPEWSDAVTRLRARLLELRREHGDDRELESAFWTGFEG